jgi:hypothetical protein
MTSLKKPVRRVTLQEHEQGLPLVVILDPDGTIAFRQKGRRKTFKTTLHACYLMAVSAEVEAERRERKRGKRGQA